MSERGIRIHFIQQGLISLDDEGKENPISKMIISILGIVAEMERKQIKERQKEGIELAKLRGVYKGRVHGSKDYVYGHFKENKNQFFLKQSMTTLHAIALFLICIGTINILLNFVHPS